VFVAFYWGRGSAGEGCSGVVTGGINGFNASEGRARLRGVKDGPRWQGELRHEGGNSRRGAQRCREAGHGGIQRWHGRGWPAWGGRES
jgi:hypothetical protein